jgi:hypothetical protein
MSVTKTLTMTRTSTNTPFFTVDNVVREHNREVYGNTGKSLGFSSEISLDRLTLTTTRSFVDQTAANEYASDPVNVAVMQNLTAYCAANGITLAQS